MSVDRQDHPVTSQGAGPGPQPQSDSTPTPSPARSWLVQGLRQAVEDLEFAVQYVALNTLGGSMFLPGSLRRLIYQAAGSRLESPPGSDIVFAGDPRHFSLGRDVYLNQRVFIEAVAPVSIGAGSAIGMECMILTSHHQIDSRGQWNPTAEGRAVVIGDRVWLGARALVLPGAVIESDVIIAAGAVVTGHCRSRGIYAGVPARRIKDFGEEPLNGNAAQ